MGTTIWQAIRDKALIAALNIVGATVLAACMMIVFSMPARAQAQEVFLPSVFGNSGQPVVEIDKTGINDPVTEVRSDVPVGKAASEFGRVIAYADKLVPPATPLSVRLLVSGVPVVNQAIAVELQVHAYELAPNTQAELLLPAGVELVEGATKAQFDMAAGETRSIDAAIAFLRPGEYAVEGVARSVISAEEEIVYGDSDTVFFTIGAEVSQAGAASRGSQLAVDRGEGESLEGGASAAPVNAEVSGAHDAATQPGGGYPEGYDDAIALSEDASLIADDPGTNQEDPSAPVIDEVPDVDPDPDALSAQTVSFCWQLRHRSGSAKPLKDAYFEIYDQDGVVGGIDDDLLGTGYLDYNTGCASQTVSDSADGPAGSSDVYVVVYLTHGGRYHVATNAGSTWWGRSTTVQNLDSDADLGTFYMGTYELNSRSDARAVWLWEDAYWTRRTINQFRSGLGGDPGHVRIMWQSGSTDGAYYSRSNQWVHLRDSDVKSPDTVVHELSHDIMDNIYDGWPISDCPSPHYINKVSGKGCAWSEGWTYLITTLVNGDGSYTWPSGNSLNLESPHCDSVFWDSGPMVEGRVAGTLIDLTDGFEGIPVPSGGLYGSLTNETGGCQYEDGASGMFDMIWDLVYDQDDMVFVSQGGETNSFADAWAARGYSRYIPHRVGLRNTISLFSEE